MKIQNTSIYVGNGLEKEVGVQKSLSSTVEKEQGSSVFGGKLNNITDTIVEKKQKAREQAMKIVGDAWAGEQKIDADIEERRKRVKDLQKEIGACNKEIQWFEEERKRLQEVYGVEDGSSEQQALELLAKEVDSRTPGKQVSLTQEEREQLVQIKEQELTEYQSRSLELKELAKDYEEQKYKFGKEIEVENAIISATRLERLKTDPMGDAIRQAEAVLEEASEEIVSMAVEAGMEHVDEELEEKVEDAKRRAEEEEAREEQLENIKEKKSENQERVTEEIIESAAELTGMDTRQAEVQKELKEVMDKMKLLAEDIKGAKVDEMI